MAGTAFDLAAEVAAYQRRGLYRHRRILAGPTGVRACADGRALRVFCSNDYLGLAADPRVAEAMVRATAHGVGAGAAHLVSGHRPEHDALETELATFLGRKRALLFSTGYMANMGVIDALLGRGDTVLQDRLNHASLLDGGRLTDARMWRYGHADADDLERRLARAKGRRLIVSDGVFSMDGDTAPLAALATVAGRHGAWLMVDDAHGLGVVGREGRGSVAAAGLDQEAVPVLVGTLGKALGVFGAFVAGSDELIDYLVQKARTFVYTTAIPAPVAAATREALRIARVEQWRRTHLDTLIRRFRRGAEDLGLSLTDSRTPIQPVVVGDATAAVQISQELERAGLLVTAIRPPTVPAGTARLRITLSASHTTDDVDELLNALTAVRRWCVA